MAAFVRVFKNKWITPPKSIQQSYEGQTIIVTGATSGIGVEAAYKFAALGAARVIITARDLGKGEATRDALNARLGTTDQITVWGLDMASYESVVVFARRASLLDRLDIAVLNAGIRRVPFKLSEHGWEEDLQVNTLSTTLLAILLLPKMRESKQATGRTPVLEIVNSGTHQRSIVPPQLRQQDGILEHYNQQEQFKEGKQYGISKVFLMYATQELAKNTSSREVIVTSVCPGLVLTNLARDHYFRGVFVLAWFFIVLFMRSPAQGANILLSGTTQGEKVHGRFWQHDKVQPLALSMSGTEMKELSVKIWHEIVEALKKDVPDMKAHISRALEA